MNKQITRQVVIDYILQNKASLYRMAYMYTKNKEDALDVVQDTVCKVLSTYHTVTEEAAIKTWIYKIVIHTAIDTIRKRSKYIYTDEVERRDNEKIRLDHYKDVDLHEALRQLDDQERALVTLRYFEDLKIQEVAKVLDLNINTTKTKLYKTLKKLKIEME